MDMVEAMWAGLMGLMTLKGILVLIFACFLGNFFGIVPGLGGQLALALTIPFMFGQPPLIAFAFFMAMRAVTSTGGSIPSIIFGIPGTGPDSATVVEGYPMAQKGEAGRAMGAALMASVLGGILGAVMMAAVIPIIRPLVLAFSPAEFFMMAVFGLTLISLVSGKSLFKGLILGCLGMCIGTIGMDPQSGILRFTFGWIYLFDGVDLIATILGIYAVAEMINLGVRGGAIAQKKLQAMEYTLKGVIKGGMELFQHFWLFLRCAVIGAVIGAVPGIGGNAAAWICYGHAVQSSKNQEEFGTGRIEGIIGPEAANNSKEAGTLIPTIAFGVPGSSGAAILLGAFLIFGLTPGPSMLIEDLDVVWAMLWAIAIANVIGVVQILAITGWIAKLTLLRGSLIIPFVCVCIMMGTFLSRLQWESFIYTLVLGVLGYALKRFDYPRPPIVMGLILGRIAERHLHTALNVWGFAFIGRPVTLILLAMTIISVLVPVYKWLRQSRPKEVSA